MAALADALGLEANTARDIPLAALMNDTTSPLADNYPSTLKLDLNGQSAAWKAVVLAALAIHTLAIHPPPPSHLNGRLPRGRQWCYCPWHSHPDLSHMQWHLESPVRLLP